MDPLKSISNLDPTKRAISFYDEFQRFAFKGNVIDLAVGVVIGTAFGKIIDSLVKNVIMPLIGLLTPAENGYSGWKLVVGGKVVPYGLFIGEVVNFLIVALALFIFVVKFLGWLTRYARIQAATVETAPPLTKEQQLLTEIRDLLKQQKAT